MQIISFVSSAILPTVLFLFALTLFFGKDDAIDTFLEGAKSGMKSCVNLLPTLILTCLGVDALFSSGGIDAFGKLLSPVLDLFNIPNALLPLVVLRPFSGSATTSYAGTFFKMYGADTKLAKTAFVFLGSTDTLLYTLFVYFGACKIKKTRYAVYASFVTYIFCLVLCVMVCSFLL